MTQPENTLCYDDALVEMFRRLDAGDRPAAEEFAARFPELESRLQAVLYDYDFLDARISGEGADPLRGQDLASEPTPLPSSKDQTFPIQFGRFTLLKELCAGSQGVVYRAEQEGTKRIVAVKIIRAGALASMTERRRFRTEIEIVSRLSHPHIVSVFQCGREDGRDYFAMEYVEGESLDQYLATRSLSVEDTLELFLQICDAIAYAHRHGVIHRDLKPSNILINDDDSVRVLDFGLARAADNDPSRTAVTQAGDFAGTWHYASPEQARRDPSLVDVRSDVYSLGVILYEALTDFLPYPVSGQAPDAAARHIQYTNPAPPRSFRRDLDDDLETIVLCTLRKERKRRYQSVAAFADDLRAYLSGEAITAKRDHALYVARKTIRRFRWQLAIAGVALAVAAAYAVTFSVLYARARTARATAEVRSEVVRKSQRYLLSKLGALLTAENVAREAAVAAPHLSSVRRLQRPQGEFPVEAVRELLSTAPPAFSAPAGAAFAPDDPTVSAWVGEHADQLDRLQRLANEVRFVFPDRRNAGAQFIFRDFDADLATALGLCRAFCAKASVAPRAGETNTAFGSLNAARSLAQNLGDNRWMFVRIMGIVCRSHIYDVALAAFSRNANGTELLPLADWVLADPPLSGLAGGLIVERERLAQLYEGATMADPGRHTPYLDVDALSRLQPGVLVAAGESRASLHALDRNTTPAVVLQLIDDYMNTLAAFDDYSYAEMQSAQEALMVRLRGSPAFPLLRTTLPSFHRMCHMRGRVDSKRAAVRLVAGLLRFHYDHERWPNSLTELATASSIDETDPYVDAPYQYRTRRGNSVLYSVNVDRIDNNGDPGLWAQPGTDLLYFPFDPALRVLLP